ncbi:MAG: DSD1 family PLP-dependent enzyme, partial [Chloroflexota bacterium]|nr:DSD1 family PLP-dependent enzyme [Chloroflexota bacterium]
VQAGGGTLGDAVYRELGVPVEPALALLAGVVSRPAPDRVVLDAGRKTIDPSARPPTPQDLDILDISFSAEHARLRLARPADSPRVGDRLLLDVGYHDQAVHLHDAIFAVRDGLIEAVWPVAARGRLQ